MEGFETRDSVKNTKKDRIENLDTLREDPLIKSATEKIATKCLENNETNKLFSKEIFKQYKVADFINRVEKTNPELWFFLSAELWMFDIKDKTYNQLTADEKLKLVAIYDTLAPNKVYEFFMWSYRNSAKKIDVTKFKQRYANQLNVIIDSFTIDFKLAQLSYGLDTKKMLEREYHFTEQESAKYMNYLEEIKQHPDHVVTQEAKMDPGVWILIWIAIGLILWYLGKSRYDNFMKGATSEVIHTGQIKINNPKDIAELLTQTAEFQTAWSDRREQFKVDTNQTFLGQKSREFLNIFQNNQIDMELNGRYAVSFNLDSANATFYYDFDKNKVIAHLKKPTIVIVESNPKVLKNNREFVHIKARDNAELELLKSLEKDVVEKASENNEVCKRAEENSERILWRLYSYMIDFQNTISGKKQPFNWVEVIVDYNAPLNVEPNNSAPINVKP